MNYGTADGPRGNETKNAGDGTGGHREVNFNWSGKQSSFTGVGLKTAAVVAEERASLRRMWRVCERAGLQGALKARAVTDGHGGRRYGR